MDDDIDFAGPRGCEGSLEILKEIVASPPANDARATGQVEPEVCVRDEQDPHVTPPQDGLQTRVRERRRDAQPQRATSSGL
jgi:hypothetical protein